VSAEPTAADELVRVESAGEPDAISRSGVLAAKSSPSSFTMMHRIVEPAFAQQPDSHVPQPVLRFVVIGL